MASQNPIIIKFTSGCSLAALLTACVSIDSIYPDQPAVAVGSTIRLNIDTNIPLQQDRIHVQDGQLLGREAVDTERVYCSVIMRGFQESGQPQLRLEPGEFIVARVRLQNDYVHNPVNYVTNDDIFYQPSFGVDFRTEIHLQASSDSNVSELRCTNHQLVYLQVGPYPTRVHIEATMGDLVDLGG